MNKQNQFQIYLISVLFSCFYLIFFNPNFYAKQHDANMIDPKYFEFSSSNPATNEFPNTVHSIALEEDNLGFTVFTGEASYSLGFFDFISNFFVFDIAWPKFFDAPSPSEAGDDKAQKPKSNVEVVDYSREYIKTKDYK